MQQPKLTKPQKELVAIIENEGGKVVDYKKGGNHLKVDYTFDDRHFFTQYIPFSSSLDRHWATTFRATVRRAKRQFTKDPT